MSDLSVNGGAAIPAASEHSDSRTTSESAKQSTSALPTNAFLGGLPRLSKPGQSDEGGNNSDLDDPLRSRYQRMLDYMPVDVEAGLRAALAKSSQQDDDTGA